MKTRHIALLLSSLALTALAEYPDAEAARKAASSFHAKKKYAEAVTAYDEAIALAKGSGQRLDYICGRADVLSADGRRG